MRTGSRMISAGSLAIALAVAGARAGDIEYGAYLAHECTTCHRQNGAGGAIPPIFGLAPDRFAQALEDFASGRRDNPTMRSVARSLGDEEIAALAAYFATLGPDGNRKP